MSAPERKIFKLVKEVLNEYLPDDGFPLLIAISGGSDSIALANILIELKTYHKRDIYAFHLNHKLREEESDRDENFVSEWCEKHSIPLKIEHIDDLEVLRLIKKQSIEEIARNVRYEKLLNEAKRTSAGAVLTGHTIDDDVETFILRMATGSSLKALSGIPICSTIDDTILIRPLLQIRRDVLREYLRDKNESWVEDRTNLQPDTLRNKVRLQVLPFLSEIFDRDVHETIARTIWNLKRETDFIESCLSIDDIASSLWRRFDTEWKYGYVTYVDDLRDIHSALRYRIIIWALDELEFPLKRRKSDVFNMLDAFIGLTGGRRCHHIGDGIHLARCGKTIIIARQRNEFSNLEFNPDVKDSKNYIREAEKMRDQKDIQKINKPGKYRFGDYEITVETIHKTDMLSTETGVKEEIVEYFDPSILEGGIELVNGSSITGTIQSDIKSQDKLKSCFTDHAKKSLVDFWVNWPVFKKQDELIWIVGICRRDIYESLGEKVVRIRVTMPESNRLYV